jgi:hypothetical protein
MPTAAVAALMGSDTPAAMEDLDGARGDADIDLSACIKQADQITR